MFELVYYFGTWPENAPLTGKHSGSGVDYYSAKLLIVFEFPKFFKENF